MAFDQGYVTRLSKFSVSTSSSDVRAVKIDFQTSFTFHQVNKQVSRQGYKLKQDMEKHQCISSKLAILIEPDTVTHKRLRSSNA